ncbi:MAG TPA: FAD-binding oxidoreductase [Sphingomicrobium sp.]|nr:FAD-binding oxidoreductase [Sphingomicrobium sp.]
MRRRTFVGTLLGTAAATALPSRLLAARIPASALDELRRRVGSRLIAVNSPLVAARSGGADADALFKALKNPYYLGDEPSLTQTLGWIDAWTSQPSAMAVAAENAADVAAAVDVARKYRLRLVVKGGGHSYFGNSNAADSLLVWTRRMQDVELHDGFVASGAPAQTAGQPAVSIGAGAIWGRVYNAVAVKGGRYVQGGGCLTVGVAGFVQGGGFGHLSKQFGTGAGNLIEAEVVTADGRVRTVNRFRDPDLFFALRGGGGGTFGIVTRLTLRTHPLPSTIGAILLSIQARNDRAWRELLERTMEFYASALFNPNWGEQIGFSPGRRLSVTMVCRDLDKSQIEALWNPLLGWVRERPGDYRFEGEPAIFAVPGRSFWDPSFLRSVPGLVLQDKREGAPSDNIFWATNLGETAQVLHAYQSAWIPATLLGKSRRTDLVDALILASSEWSVTLHTNKGLAGGSREALASTAETSTSPELLDAFALLICSAEGPPAWPGIKGHEPDLADGRRQARAVERAMRPIRALVPKAGAYMSEADYFQKDWQRAYWGEHYQRLQQIKRKYDPDNLFRGHQTVTAG